LGREITLSNFKRQHKKNTKHGMSDSRVNHVCRAAKQRCENPKHPSYKDYGGRGIQFLWTSFETFFAEMGAPLPGATLERRDNDSHYESGNNYWATRIEQNNNTRRNRKLKAFGKTQTVAQWAREFNIAYHTLWSRLSAGLTPEQAMPTKNLTVVRGERRR
jgi:hypothetical protein